MRLDRFDNTGFDRGAGKLKELLWLAASGLLVSSWLPGSGWRVFLLRMFGANIGNGVVIKQRVFIKFPWKLSVGDYAWIGEAVWIDNLAQVSIGQHACVSQGVYLCTGSHDWSLSTFDLVTKPITVANQAWLGAFSRVAPGVEIGEGAVLSMGSTATRSLEKWTISAGVPAVVLRNRIEKS